jgi:Rieske Fe-S protein
MVLLLATRVLYLKTMPTKETTKSKNLKSEIDITKAELEAFKRNPDSDPYFVISKGNEFIKFMKTNRVFELRHENAFSMICLDMPCAVSDLPQFIEYALEDFTDHALATMHKEDYMQHRKLLQGLKLYFQELLVEQTRRPNSHE